MKLDRNINPDGRGKYALLLQREIPDGDTVEAEAIRTLTQFGILDFGGTPDTEFFVIRLKDKYAAPALEAYAIAAAKDDSEWGMEVMNLANKAAKHPHQRRPD